jgi:hypothetical protein
VDASQTTVPGYNRLIHKSVIQENILNNIFQVIFIFIIYLDDTHSNEVLPHATCFTFPGFVEHACLF